MNVYILYIIQYDEINICDSDLFIDTISCRTVYYYRSRQEWHRTYINITIILVPQVSMHTMLSNSNTSST
jgi:hypothetical protein